MKKANLSIFVPHLGCPNLCSFCEQTNISGAASAPTPAQVMNLCKDAQQRMSGQKFSAQIAFFGGSFTAIDRDYMIALLEAAAPFTYGVFSGIRISTRPDCINTEILSLLKKYRVKTIELGAQSMSDAVLLKNRRGHTAKDVCYAAKLIQDSGFSLGLQMMTGLDGADATSDLKTGEQLAALNPDCVRIYPTIVMDGSELAERYRMGQYQPQTLAQAVTLGAQLLELFEQIHKIPVIRMGLHAQKTLEQGMLAGPYHPAFRELCEGKLLCDMIEKSLETPGRYQLHISPKSCSKLTGHGAHGIEKLRKMGYYIKIIQDPELSGLQFKLEGM